MAKTKLPCLVRSRHRRNDAIAFGGFASSYASIISKKIREIGTATSSMTVARKVFNGSIICLWNNPEKNSKILEIQFFIQGDCTFRQQCRRVNYITILLRVHFLFITIVWRRYQFMPLYQPNRSSFTRDDPSFNDNVIYVVNFVR